MQTRQIPFEQWQPFFSNFTYMHQGEHVNVETMREDDRAVRSRLCDVPLVGVVSAQPQKAGQEEWIDVIARDASGAHAIHSIAEPSNMRLAEEEDGQAVALQIESADGSITMIRFEPSSENMPPGFIVSS
jgi:hypothetical protein